jgi:hypothetical protein
MDLFKLRVNRGFSARELQDFGLPFRLDESIDGTATIIDRQMLSTRSTDGKADGTFEIAGGVDFEDADTCVLFMFSAKTAVVRTTLANVSAPLVGNFSGQTEGEPVKPAGVTAHKVFTHPMSFAGLAEVDTVVSGQNLCRNDGQAIGAEALSEAKECRVAKFCHRPGCLLVDPGE